MAYVYILYALNGKFYQKISQQSSGVFKRGKPKGRLKSPIVIAAPFDFAVVRGVTGFV